MKFKKLYSLSATFIITGCFVVGLAPVMGEKYLKQPANTGKSIPRQELKLTTDTIVVDDKNYQSIRGSSAAGVFLPFENKLVVYYFQVNSENPRIKNFCDHNNKLIPLTRRHEMEHARKAALTKITSFYPADVRGKIAAANEIMAPASEIIEALDYRYIYGRPFPETKQFIKNADAEIIQIMDSLKLNWPVNFNNQKIADVVIKHALERFTGEFNRGLYRTTIRCEVEQISPKRYIPHNKCNTIQFFMFAPTYDNWGALWEFETQGGTANIWNAASMVQKQILLNALDTFVAKSCNIPGKNAPYLLTIKTR